MAAVRSGSEKTGYGSDFFSPESGSLLRIQIRMYSELLRGSGSGVIVSDLDPAKNERVDTGTL